MSFFALILVAAPLHLSEAFARAKEASPDLLAAGETVRAAQGAVTAAGAFNNPTVAATKGPDDPTVTASIDVKLPLFGQRGAAVAAAERDVQAAEADALAKSVQVRAAVHRAYAALAGAQERARLAQASFELAADLERRAQARFQLGSAPELEAVQAGVARRRAAQDNKDKAAALVGAREDLARLLAVADAQSLSAADPLLPLPEAPKDLRVEQHPEVQSFLRQQDAALARAARERAAVRPIPDLSLEYERLHGDPVVGFRWGIAFDLPVLSWNSGRVNEAQAQAQSAAWQAQGALAKRGAELRSALARWNAASARATSFANELVPAAEQLLKMAREAWELGRAPLTTVLQAQGELTSARADASDAAVAAHDALADIEEASGEPL